MTMPAGEYWIGDLCYVMNDVWEEFCEHLDTQGEITLKDGRKVAWYHTAYGDGTYEDQYGCRYGVDAGLIGCIKMSDIKEATSGDLGYIHHFHSDFNVSYGDGKIKFGELLIIDTDPSNDEWESSQSCYEEDYDGEWSSSGC